MYIVNILALFLISIYTQCLWAFFHDHLVRKEVLGQKMYEPDESSEVDRWNEGLANHERLKKILPFMNEDEGYL
jgi:hypothetical protein